MAKYIQQSEIEIEKLNKWEKGQKIINKIQYTTYLRLSMGFESFNSINIINVRRILIGELGKFNSCCQMTPNSNYISKGSKLLTDKTTLKLTQYSVKTPT